MNIQNEDQEWINYRNSFSKSYDETVLNASRLQNKVITSGRKKMESFFGTQTLMDSVIEIGAGTGEHYPFVNHKFNHYCFTDADEGALNVAKNKYKESPECLSFNITGASSLPFEDNSFDRLISAHVLEHLYHPHLALKEWVRVTKPGGIISILIPTDPGLLWRFGRTLGPRKRALARGEPYDYLMARDHVNPCHNLIALIKFYFKENVTEQWWPLSAIPAYDINLFYIAHCRK